MRAGIAGAGLIGKLVAWQLTQHGWHVSLFDPDSKARSSAAFAAAGMLSPYAEIHADTKIFSLGLQGIAAWKNLLAQFSDQSWWQQRGSIVTAHTHDQNLMRDFIAQINNKIPYSTYLHLPNKKLTEYEPELTAKQGVFLREEAVIDSRKLLNLLPNANIHQQVISVKPHQIITTHQQYKFDWVFDCRGSGGGENFSDLRSVRGELIYLAAPEVTISRPIHLLHPRYQVYIVPRKHPIYLIGASEIEANDNSPISVRTCLELLSAAYSLHRGFAEARIIETITGLRPALADNLPRIIFNKGMVAINGLYRYGFLLAPIILHTITQALFHQEYSHEADLLKWEAYRDSSVNHIGTIATTA
jgi:glycine oxidase